MSTTPSPRRWVTPEGARLDLTHATHTGRNRGRRGLRDGGSWDGYCLTTTHPSGVVLCENYFGATVPEPELAAALAAIEAYDVTGLPTPPKVTR